MQGYLAIMRARAAPKTVLGEASEPRLEKLHIYKARGG
jgi:hypothetical protein